MDFLISFSGNVIATTMCHPIDVVKTQYQTTIPRVSVYDSIKYVVHNKAFFRGLGPNLATYPIFWGVFFQTRQLLSSYSIKDTTLNKFVISYVAGNIASLIANPLFVMKVQMQTSKLSYIKTIKKIGVVGLYSGFAATAINNAKLSIQFPLYDWTMNKTDHNIIASAVVAKGIATSLMYPLDLVRVQQRKSLQSDTVFNILSTIYNREGFRGLYRGVLLYNCISTPHFVVMMVAMNYLQASR